MNDKVYQKQLEKFGIESTVIVEGDLNKKRQLEFLEIHNSVVNALMASMEGRQWLYSKLDMCRIFTTPFVASDPYGTAFFSGVQAVGHNLLNDIMAASPENYFLMVQEAAARNTKRD